MKARRGLFFFFLLHFFGDDYLALTMLLTILFFLRRQSVLAKLRRVLWKRVLVQRTLARVLVLVCQRIPPMQDLRFRFGSEGGVRF